MSLLESYVAGRWHRAPDEGRPLHDATTGEEVARLSSTGVDLAAMTAYAREVGGPALRALTFHERALLLKQVALALTEDKASLDALSTRTGATRRDTAVDVDGGIGTLFSYSSTARRELPNDTVVLDGAPVRLSRAGRFAGQHLWTSRTGVAVQVNAFNFPVWGFLEKLAPALLAGLPTIVKPAAQTAYLTELVVRRMVASGVLPEGSLQLLCGSPAGLLDELGPQDSVAFTGSAATAAHLRQHEAVLHHGVRLGVEADSLNCSILGPDIGADDPELALFVDAVVTEMTVKAGQKCTAIRRVLVTASRVEEVCAAIADRLAGVRVGDPARDDVAMGPLVGLAQRDEVRKAVQALRGSAELVFGDPDHVEVVGADEAAGGFLSPVLLRAPRDAAEPHEVEAFGPVATVIGYRDLDDAVALAARGAGSLVASVVTRDPVIARHVVRGLAPWHGRVLVLDRDAAPESTGHGSPLPTLVHGGPGRAGGGEELGGVRAVFAHLQRTALQGSPDLLTAVTGSWSPGAHRAVGDVHPFRRTLDQLRVGDTVQAGPRTVTREDIDAFAALTGDTFYAHTDEAAAAENPLFGGIVAHGYLVVALAAGLFVDPAPGPVLANAGVDRLRFLAPVRAGDELSVALTVKQISRRIGAEHGEVRWDCVVSAGEVQVATYDVLTMVAVG